jgi:cystathionine beta-synthase
LTGTGTLLSAALRYCRAQSRPKRVVTFACDSGNKYLWRAVWNASRSLTR